jgi:hypothetical protein
MLEDESCIRGYHSDSGIKLTFSPQLCDVLPQATPPITPELYYTANADTDYTVFIHAINEMEYSFDGVNFDTANYLKGVKPGDTITGYLRYPAKPHTDSRANYAPSEATETSMTLPLFRTKTPQSTPRGQAFTNNLTISLTCNTKGASIYYTTNGSTPTVNSNLYLGEFTLTATTIVKAIAVKDDMIDSYVMTSTFNKKTRDYSNNPSESIFLMPDNAALTNTKKNDVSFENLILVEISDGTSITRLTPKDLTVNSQMYLIKLPKVPAGASINISLARPLDKQDTLLLAQYINNSTKTMNGVLQFVLEAHPVTRAHQLKIAGITCKGIGTAILNEFGLGAEQTAQILAGEGFSYTETAETLWSAGFEPLQIANALLSVYDLTLQKTSQVLFDLNFDVLETVFAVVAIYNKPQATVLCSLKEAGYSPDDITVACREYYKDPDKQVAIWLYDLGYKPAIIADSLINVYDTSPRRVTILFTEALGYDAEVTLDILLVHLELTPKDAVSYTYYAGAPLDDITLSLMAFLSESTIVPPSNMASQAFTTYSVASFSSRDDDKGLVRTTIETIAGVLPIGDKAPESVANLFEAILSVTLDTEPYVMLYLLDIYGADNVCDAMYRLLDLSVGLLADKISSSSYFLLGSATVELVAIAFDNLGIKSEVIFEVLSFSGEYLQICGSWCYDTLCVPLNYLSVWFIEGDFDYNDLHLFFTQTIHVGLGILLGGYDLAINFCDKMMWICKDAGIVGQYAAYIFAGLKYPFIGWGYMWGFVYDLTDSVNYIRYLQLAYDTSLAGALWMLTQIGYGAVWAEGIFKQSIALAQYSAEVIASAFKYAYNYSLDQISIFLRDIGQSAEQLFTIAKNVYAITSEAAVKAYVETLKLLNYTISQIESALGTVWNFMKDAWNWITKIF